MAFADSIYLVLYAFNTDWFGLKLYCVQIKENIDNIVSLYGCTYIPSKRKMNYFVFFILGVSLGMEQRDISKMFNFLNILNTEDVEYNSNGIGTKLP